MPQQENSSSFYRDLEQRLEQLRQQGQWRELRRSDYGLPEMTFEGTRYLNLSSNDYLGLANDAALRGEFLSRVQDTRLGATGSRLMTGNTLPYADFEQQLERTYGLPALVFGSGYHANTGVLPALVSSGDLVLADRLVHASILDGVLASKADFQRYRHNDYEHLETLLARNRSRYRYVWIVSETIFSMDGDRADLARLVDLKNRYEALLYLDEAHSIGTDGEDGLGMCRQAGVLEQVDVAVFPMGKAMASHGGIRAGQETPAGLSGQYFAALMIFSTALPPGLRGLECLCLLADAVDGTGARAFAAQLRATARRAPGNGLPGVGSEPHPAGGLRGQRGGFAGIRAVARTGDLGHCDPLPDRSPGRGEDPPVGQLRIFFRSDTAHLASIRYV